nr:Gag-Pol polyprotein [Tanacetum cinerariifolium]
MASDQNSSNPAPECQTMALEHDSLCPRHKCQENVSHGNKTGTTSNELDMLFSLMFNELLNGSSKVVSKSSAVSAADALNERQQLTTPLNNHTTSHGDKTGTTSNELDMLFSLMFNELLNGSSKVVSKSSAVSAANALNERQQLTTPLNNHTTPAPTCQIPSIAPTVISSENINQAEPHAENDEVADDEFINIFSTPVQDQGETSPLCSNVINLKWLWKNKHDEENTVIRNKSRLVAKGYAQKEGVDFEESFAPVARL